MGSEHHWTDKPSDWLAKVIFSNLWGEKLHLVGKKKKKKKAKALVHPILLSVQVIDYAEMGLLIH